MQTVTSKGLTGSFFNITIIGIGITYFQNDSPSTQPFAAILPRPAELQSLASTPRQDSGNSHTVCIIISLAAYIAFNLRVAICNEGN